MTKIDPKRILGCGIDLEKKGRFQKHLFPDGTYSNLIKDIFSIKEIEKNKSIGIDAFSLGFCCKEAFFKALGVSWTNSPIDWKEIQLLIADLNEPVFEITLSGYAEELMKTKAVTEFDATFQILDNHYQFQIILFS